MKNSRSSSLNRSILLTLFVVGFIPQTCWAQVCNYCVRPFEFSPTHKEERVHTGLEFQYIYRAHVENQRTDIAPNKDEKVADSVMNLYGSYDLLSDLNVEVNVPFISKAYSLYAPQENLSERESGLGDVMTMASYNLLAPETRVDHITWQIRGGVKLPTGDSDYLRDERDPPLIQQTSLVRGRDLALGSGSVDIPLGTRLLYVEDSIFAIADAGYTLRTEGDHGYQYGNGLSLGTALGFTVAERPKRLFKAAAVARYDNREKDSLDGNTVANSGNSVLSVGPSLEAVLGDVFLGHLEVTAPVYRDANGAQLLPDYQIQANIIAYF